MSDAQKHDPPNFLEDLFGEDSAHLGEPFTILWEIDIPTAVPCNRCGKPTSGGYGVNWCNDEECQGLVIRTWPEATE